VEGDRGYQAVATEAGPLHQLSTFGSDQRRSDPTVSQTLQLDRAMARQFVDVVRTAYPGL